MIANCPVCEQPMSQVKIEGREFFVEKHGAPEAVEVAPNEYQKYGHIGDVRYQCENRHIVAVSVGQ